MTYPSRRARAATAGLALLAVALAPALQQLPAIAASSETQADRPGASTPVVTTIGDSVAGLLEVDQAGPAVQPGPAQLSAASALGNNVSVTWNEAGTPASIFPKNGVLSPAPRTAQSPAAAALAWITANRELLGLDQAQVADLDLVSEQPLADSAARAVLYRQKFGGLIPATRGMVTVAVGADGSIAYATSSLLRGRGTVPAVNLTPTQGWLKAAAYVERPVTGSSLAGLVSKVSDGWTRLSVPGFDQTQLARLRAFVKNDGTIHPVIEADVIDTSRGTSTAYRVMVDAADGSLLLRHNAVENSNNAYQFQGAYTGGPTGACGQPHAFTLTDGNTKTIAVVAAAVVALDDITIKLNGPGGTQSFDLLTSPEVATFTPTGAAFAAGQYTVQVCPYDSSALGGPYTVAVTTTDAGASAGGVSSQPRWRAFTANPDLASVTSTTGQPANSVIECWFAGTADCTARETHENVASFGPWDQINLVPTLTTVGNNANTHEAWASPLSPGGAVQAPVSATRDYTSTFTDVWNNTKCNPANLVPGGNDINAVVTNLFTGHNRIHDFSYYLGFTERNYNLQLDNGGRGGQGGDQEVGNVQAGALSGGSIGQYMGRDNANQIALQDGAPGITNQYLFQPIAGAFYSPCADGSMDTGIYGHEYTHAISNRMVGGPDDGLTSEQGGAMGESWSDLNAAEYQFENNYPTGTNPWSLGSYTTGNFAKGTRDYAINDNPLNYGDYGFDSTGAEVHADGEIWNGTLWEVRQALVNKWDANGFDYSDKDLQLRCAEATSTASPLNASACPGNRRWLQLIFDAWLLQQGATDMLQARDAMVIADRLRFRGADEAIIAAAFARRGMGAGASTVLAGDPDPDSTDVLPSFRSAFGNNSAVTFTAASSGRVYVGNYEARATPVADTDPSTPQGAAATFTPGIYRMTFASPTSGFRRFILTVPDNGVAFSQPVNDQAVNLAAAPSGAKVITAATTAGSLNADSLIDGTEETNWGGVTASQNVDVSHPGVAVDLAGGVSTISAAKVSALLRPAPASATDVPLLVGGARADDPNSGSRFTALRQFALQACTSGCDNAANYRTFYTSAPDAFPGDIPRPVAPDQTMRTFRFAPVQAAAIRLVALNNQCTGQAKYAGEQDNDPTNATDCKTASDRGTIVHAAELQVFGDAIPDDPAEATAGDGTPGSGTAGQGTSAPALPGQPSLTNPPFVPTGAVKLKVKTHTRIRLPRVQQIRGKESTPMKYQVVAKTTSNGAKAGVAVVKLDGKKVKKVKIAVTKKHGKKVVGKTYRVPKSLGYGKHTLIVKFKSSDPGSFKSSKSRKIVIYVVRVRHGMDES